MIVGGRVLSAPSLLDRVRVAFREIAGRPSFPYYPEMDNLETFIVGDSEREGTEVGKPGIVGALCIAAMEHQAG